MRVLVTFAVEAEFAPWRKLRTFQKRPIGAHGRTVFTTGLEDVQVTVFLTGMGGKACEESLSEHDFDRDEPFDLVISSGLAGALKETLKPGDTVVPLHIRTLNSDTSGAATDQFLKCATDSGGTAIHTMITAKKLVQTVDDKNRLAFFGEAVDMESAYVMAKAIRASVPCVTIRTISDASNEDLPIDFDRCLTPQGAIKPMNLLNTLVASPRRLPKLIRFGKQSYQAARDLAVFLDRFIVAISKLEVQLG